MWLVFLWRCFGAKSCSSAAAFYTWNSCGLRCSSSWFCGSFFSSHWSLPCGWSLLNWIAKTARLNYVWSLAVLWTLQEDWFFPCDFPCKSKISSVLMFWHDCSNLLFSLWRFQWNVCLLVVLLLDFCWWTCWNSELIWRFSVPGMLLQEVTTVLLLLHNGCIRLWQSLLCRLFRFLDTFVKFYALVVSHLSRSWNWVHEVGGVPGSSVAMPRLVFLPLCCRQVTPQRLTGPWKPLPTVTLQCQCIVHLWKLLLGQLFFPSSCLAYSNCC